MGIYFDSLRIWDVENLREYCDIPPLTVGFEAYPSRISKDIRLLLYNYILKSRIESNKMYNPPIFQVRLFQREDQEAALSLQDEFIEEFFPEFVGDPRLDEWNKDVNNIYSSYIEGAGVFWVVENSMEVVGMGGIKISEETPVISRVRVRKRERGKGIGTLLLRHMQEYCFREGYKKILVDTENHMSSAVRFYESHNFLRIRETVEEIDGKVYTTFFYEKYL